MCTIGWFLSMKKILILFKEDRCIETYPYILNLIKLLHRKYGIDFLVTPEMYNGYYLENLTLLRAELPNYTKSAIRHLRKHSEEYSMILAYGIEGVLAARYHNILHFWKKIPFAYFSMELVDVKKKCPRFVSCLLYLFPTLQSEMLKFLVIQDTSRAEALKKYFNLVDKVFILPNSYIGCTSEASTFAHEKFNIPANKKILLYTGAIERWSYDIHLAKYLSKLLNDDYVLLLSGFSRDNYMDMVVEEYAGLVKEKKVVINTEILNESDYTELVKSATIGLVWYKKLDTSLCTDVEVENIYLVGLSSGKLCKYLSCSIPVVAPSFYACYKEFVEDKKVGKVSDYGEEIVDKILEISSNYGFYKCNAESVYRDELEYSNQCLGIVNEIEKIIS
jgi:hypothetical protein